MVSCCSRSDFFFIENMAIRSVHAKNGNEVSACKKWQYSQCKNFITASAEQYSQCKNGITVHAEPYSAKWITVNAKLYSQCKMALQSIQSNTVSAKWQYDQCKAIQSVQKWEYSQCKIGMKNSAKNGNTVNAKLA